MKQDDQRITHILDVLTSFMKKDFTHFISVAEADEFDAIGGGINAMAKELQFYIENQRRLEDQLTEVKADLEEKVIERTAKLITGELQFRTTLNKMLEGMQIISFDWRYIFINDALVRQIHMVKDNLIGRTMMEVYPGIEKSDVFMTLKTCMDLRVAKHLENEFVFPDQSRAWFELSIQPVPEGIFVLSIDITDRKKAEDKYKTSELQYRSLIEQATDGIFICDQKGDYLDVNPGACSMLGYSKDELLHMNINEILSAKDARSSPPRFDELRSGKSIISTRDLLRKDGSVLPVEINAKMLSNGNMLGMARDITERKAAQVMLEKNEKLFRKLIEKNADIMMLVLSDGTLKYVSPSLTIIFGFQQEEYLYHSIFDFIDKDDVNSLKQEIKEVIQSDKPALFVQHKMIHKRGRCCWCEGTVTNLLHDPDIGALIFNFRDVTARKEAEEKIEASEILFRHTLDKMMEGVQIHNFNWQYTYVNDSLAQYSKTSKDDLIGRTLQEKFPGIEKTDLFGTLNECMQNRVSKHFETEFIFPDGSSSYFELSIQPVPTGIFILSIDITERKKTDEQVKRLNEELERKVLERTAQLDIVNKELESFSYSVSHDLRAPLRAVSGYSKILEQDFGEILPADGQRTIRTIQQNVLKMNTLIDDLLAFSKLGTKTLTKSVIQTDVLIGDILTEIKNSTNHSASITIRNLLPSFGDISLLTQVWINLISNAIKYSSKKETPQIEIGSYEENNATIFYIRDNGAGFDMQYIDRLFGVFQRLHLAREFEGTGIGLSIVKRIVTRHNGKVWAEAQVDQGAIFYFSLPITPHEINIYLSTQTMPFQG